jgi:hypothetical protein
LDSVADFPSGASANAPIIISNTYLPEVERAGAGASVIQVTLNLNY